MDSYELHDRLTQAEHVQDYLDLCAGGRPLTDIEIDSETYDLIGKLSLHYGLTRRQTLHKIIQEGLKDV